MGSGRTTAFGYDVLDRLTSQWFYNSGQVLPERSVAYQYDLTVDEGLQ